MGDDEFKLKEEIVKALQKDEAIPEEIWGKITNYLEMRFIREHTEK